MKNTKQVAATLMFNAQQLHRNALHLQRRNIVESQNLMNNYIMYNLNIICQSISTLLQHNKKSTKI